MPSCLSYDNYRTIITIKLSYDNFKLIFFILFVRRVLKILRVNYLDYRTINYRVFHDNLSYDNQDKIQKKRLS